MATVTLSPILATPVASETSFAPDYAAWTRLAIDKINASSPVEGADQVSMGLTPAQKTTVVMSPVVQLFRIRGWYSPGNTFEVWVGSSPYDPPPSGHTLQDISFVPFDVGFV